ncbi:polysaccharide deacetylase family protein [Candidatus Saccharibacteria bacterium]|nr:polysaccharide deacetylase family protein [Candidatus Saccharibacteria bacterium]
MSKNKVLLSFDVEEFDLPREHGGEISVKEGVKVSSSGLLKILDLLRRKEVKATFFVTGNFARVNPELVSKIVDEGHEVACHGVDHFEPKKSDIKESIKIVGKLARIYGYRQPRMFGISYSDLKDAGYKYDSSVNPAFIPGRYNHFGVPRKPFIKEGVLEIPTTVATFMRVPLFWLALHLFSKRLYLKLALMGANKTGHLATYFHPWEFADELVNYKEVPGYIKKNSGDRLVEKLEFVIEGLKKKGLVFETYHEFADSYLRSSRESSREIFKIIV